jgi:putative transposase
MLKVVQKNEESNDNRAEAVGGSLLDEIVRDGARQMLAAALQAEVAVYVKAHCGERDEVGHRLVVRNGHHVEREVTTAAGAVAVRAPRVNDKRVDESTGQRKRFSSAILPAWSRKSPWVAEVLPLLYLHGLSSSDFGRAATSRRQTRPGPGQGVLEGGDPDTGANAGRDHRRDPAGRVMRSKRRTLRITQHCS